MKIILCSNSSLRFPSALYLIHVKPETENVLNQGKSKTRKNEMSLLIWLWWLLKGTYMYETFIVNGSSKLRGSHANMGSAGLWVTWVSWIQKSCGLCCLHGLHDKGYGIKKLSQLPRNLMYYVLKIIRMHFSQHYLISRGSVLAWWIASFAVPRREIFSDSFTRKIFSPGQRSPLYVSFLYNFYKKVFVPSLHRALFLSSQNSLFMTLNLSPWNLSNISIVNTRFWSWSQRKL